MAITNLLLSWQAAVTAALLLATYLIAIAVYRLYFSPLANFPGPTLAATTFLYEFHYDVIGKGSYIWKIKDLHEQYGPIIRINPYELHINDPSFYDVLYSGPSHIRDKWDWSAKMFGKSESVFGTTDHIHHRARRTALNPFFSRQSILKLEPLIHTLIEKLCTRIDTYTGTGRPLNIRDAYTALTVDIITEYCFASPNGSLDDPNLGRDWHKALMDTTSLVHINAHCPWLVPIIRATPEWIIKLTNAQLMSFVGMTKSVQKQIVRTLHGRQRPANEPEQTDLPSHHTIFYEILDSSLPPQEKTLPRLLDEAVALVSAGTVTTAHFLEVTTFHLLSQPITMQKLRAELAAAFPNAGTIPPLIELEKLPFLQAVIKEGMRLSYGVAHRLQRIAPTEPMSYGGWTIPPGTPVSMTAVYMHQDPTLFPEPTAFRPERWLGPDSAKKERYLANFSRGTRQCLGINLAELEIYTTLATMIRRFDFELFETDVTDVELAHDFFNPLPRLDSKGVRVLVA